MRELEGPYSGGNHQYLVKGHLRIAVPNPHGGDIEVGLPKRVLRQAGIGEEDWLGG